MTDWQPEKLRDFFFHYDFANPNHKQGVDLLQKHAAEIMNDNAEWVRAFRGENRSSNDCLNLAADIIAEYEGFVANPYLCPAGVWTIGYGTTYYPNGKLVGRFDSPITKGTATGYLINHIEKVIIPGLSGTIPTWGAMNDYQRAAIISFAYNLGTHFYGGKNFNTITKALSTTSNWSQVPSALMLYVNPGSSFEAGLKRRRKAEADLWMTTT